GEGRGPGSVSLFHRRPPDQERPGDGKSRRRATGSRRGHDGRESGPNRDGTHVRKRPFGAHGGSGPDLCKTGRRGPCGRPVGSSFAIDRRDISRNNTVFKCFFVPSTCTSRASAASV